jgi:hypothetical protein
MDPITEFRDHQERHRAALAKQTELVPRRAALTAELQEAQRLLADAERAKDAVYDRWILSPNGVESPEAVLRDLSERRLTCESITEAIAAVDRLAGQLEQDIEQANAALGKLRGRAFAAIAEHELAAVDLEALRALARRVWACTWNTQRAVRHEHWAAELLGGEPTFDQVRETAAELAAAHGLS